MFMEDMLKVISFSKLIFMLASRGNNLFEGGCHTVWKPHLVNKTNRKKFSMFSVIFPVAFVVSDWSVS